MKLRYNISSDTSAVQGDNHQGIYKGVVEIPSVENSFSFSMTISESNENYSFFSSFARSIGFYGVKKNHEGLPQAISGDKASTNPCWLQTSPCGEDDWYSGNNWRYLSEEFGSFLSMAPCEADRVI